MKTIKFVWTAGHAGISGNEKADKGAKMDLRQCLPLQSTMVAADMIKKNKPMARQSLRGSPNL
jgi:ribonuclease HI